MASNNSKRPSPVKAELLGGGPRHDAAFYASYGLAGKYISRLTGLRHGQVSYAIKLGKVRISDYRNGIGNVATIVMKLTQQEVDDQLYKYLKKTL
jgi:hypothetical protein